MKIEKNTFTRRDMVAYLLEWSRNADERSEDAEQFAGMSDSELAEAFYKEYDEMRGIIPPPDVDKYDYLIDY